MKDGSDEKMMLLFWLHWLHAPSLVSIGKELISKCINLYLVEEQRYII